MGFFGSTMVHGPELQHGERDPGQADPLLPKEDRASRRGADGDGKHEPHG